VGLKRLEVKNLALDVPARRLFSGFDFALAPGECIAIKGPSGAGKTSLLNCIAGIIPSASGSILVDGLELNGQSSSERAQFRLRNVGMVFQFGELLPELTLLENVALPLRLLNASRSVAEKRADAWLTRVGLSERANDRPDDLSGGEIQRVGIARALVHNPKLVLADEPTGMLDEENTRRVIDILIRSAKEQSVSTLLVTHDPLVALAADRVLSIKDSLLVTETPSQSKAAVPL
jgi:ABC-type lipoprotein export system ATPase subunit